MECRLDRITVHYEDIGEGRPLVVIPGWPDEGRVPADYLEPVFEDRTGWRRFYLDLPGRGQTRGEPWITTNDQVLEIVLDVLDRVVGSGRFALAGHSAGAYLARGIVHERGDRVVGLLQVVPELDRGDEDWPAHMTLASDPRLLERIEAELGPAFADTFGSFFVVQSAAVYERIRPLWPALRNADRTFLDALESTLSFEVDPPAMPFARPALFLLGRQDSVTGYRAPFDLAAAYPRATIAILDRAGHGLAWEQDGLTRALIGEWLDRLEAEPPA